MDNSRLMRQLTTSPEQHQALHFAFYNALLFVATGICLVGLYAVYKVMYMFLTPILWATLVGTILFPAKRRCRYILNDWLSELDVNNTPLLIAIFLLPFQCLLKLSDIVLFYGVRVEGAIAVVLYLLIKLLDYGNFISIIGFFARLYDYMDMFVLFCTRKWMFAFALLYFAGYAGWIYVQDRSSINKKIARVFSVPLWVFGLSLISSFCGPFRPLVFILCSVVLALIAAGVISPEESPKPSEKKTEPDSETHEEKEPGAGQIETEPKDKTVGRAVTGDHYIQIVFGLCLILFTARNDFMVFVIMFLGLFAAFRKIGEVMKVQSSFVALVKSLWDTVSAKLDLLVHITIAGHMRKFVKFLFTSDKVMRDSLRSSLDVLSSIFVMCLLAFGAIFLVVFSALQLHNETVHLVKLGSDLLSKQPEWLMSARNYTEGQLAQHDIDDYVNQAYTKGREFLSENVRKLVGPDDVERADILEKQVMQFTDDLYRMWEERDSVTKRDVNGTAVSLLDKLKSADLAAFKAEVMKIVQENVDTILNVARSLWSVLTMNVTLITSFLMSIAGIVLGLGLNVVNFFIETIVFLTAVYYLLASSKDRWLPLKWISDAMPTSKHDDPLKAMTQGVTDATQPSFSSADITTAIENAISGVFVLSAKMAVFYGLYTYFVHSLFDLNIVFLPSILATIFGAVPVMAPYTVCAIGVFELFLVRGETAAAICFLLASAAPVCFADATFYRELKGSHPYVTGLSIVGGMYWLGLQGAIFGPIVLCSMLVLFNVYAKYAKS